MEPGCRADVFVTRVGGFSRLSGSMRGAGAQGGCAKADAFMSSSDNVERAGRHEAAIEHERRFRLLVESIVDYALYMLDPSGIVITWNAGAQRIEGYSAAEIVGRHFSRLYPREDRAAGMPARVLDVARR